jgi:hypothetical protein
MDTANQYYFLSHLAIENGILTREERDTISRVGTRKEGYWSRHLLDLCGILKKRSPDGDLKLYIDITLNYLRKDSMDQAKMFNKITKHWKIVPNFPCPKCGQRRSIIGFDPPDIFTVLCWNPKCSDFDQPVACRAVVKLRLPPHLHQNDS